MSRRAIPSRRRRPAGFTLIELLVATTLSTIVLLGVFNIFTNMLTAEVDSMRNGTVTAWSLAGISSMNADIAAAGAIGYPAKNAVGANSLIVCTNWSMATAPPAQVVTGAGVKTGAYYYCWDTIDAAPSPYANALLRMVVKNAGTCPTVPPACNSAAYSSGDYGGDTIVATGVYQNGASSIFVQDPNTKNAVRLNFIVGNPAANANSAGGNGGTVTAKPVSIPFNTEIILED
jgi:prepilin-type N-terminal cleavage/methylation domain-containing protein